MSCSRIRVGLAVFCLFATAAASSAAPYTISKTDGGNWQTLYVQGFNSSLGATPDPGLTNGDPVYLTQFEFFKSGTADTAANIRLAILNSLFPNSPTVTNTTTTSPTVVALSSNTVLSTAAIATGDPIAFTFNNAPLTYGGDYAAVFVNVGVDVGNGAPLTPVRVSALAANYADVGGGDFHPTTNYGTEAEFNYATSNFINNGFFSTFSYAGDANFRATLDAVPEPAAISLALYGFGLAIAYKRRNRKG
jgi:hypothetical protein